MNGRMDPHVLLKVEGGSEIGMGHVERSIALANQLEANGRGPIAFWANEAPSPVRRLRASRFPLLGTGEDGFLEVLREREPEGILFDQSSPLDDLPRRVRLRRHDVWLGALDCFEMEIEGLDLVVNLFNHGSPPDHPIDPDVRYLEGTEYALLREDFRAHRSERVHEGPVDSVIVTFGGSDPNDLSRKVLSALPADTLANATVDLIAGPCFDTGSVSAVTDGSSVDVDVHEDPENLEQLMASADLALAGAGTTALELAYLGTPTLVVAQTDEELAFANHLADRGIVELVGFGRKVSNSDIREKFNELAENADRRQTLSGAAQAAVDGRGCERIAEEINNGLEARS